MKNRTIEKSIRLCWSLAMVCLVTMSVEAAPVDAAAAQSRASQYVKSRAAGRMAPAVATVRLAHAEPSAAVVGASDYYVFDVSNDGGFVIVAGDDRAEQVLAWGESSIDMANLPCNLACVLDIYKEQMEWLHAHPSAQVKTPSQLLSSEGEFTVAPLLSCTWGQSEPYYNQCPEYKGERCVTGCVATAMAQVMYYWKYPANAPALSAYWLASLEMTISALSSKPIDWSNMIDSYAVGYTPEQGEAVAMLMRYCGQSCRMSYSPDGSGAYVQNQLNGMMSFGYSRAASMLNRPQYSYEAWDALIKEDLAAGRPVLYSANDPMAGGHAFVLDGYYDGKYHINWGWNNKGNGYFVLDAFVVLDYFFGASQQMLHKIYPNNVQPTVNSNHDFEAGGIYYQYNEQHTAAIVSSCDTRFDSYSGTVTIPSQVVVDGVTLPVTAIGEKAFRNCMNLTGVELPDGITSIGRQAFINCVALQQIVIPASVKHIGELAFQDCINLTRVETPSIDCWLDIEFDDHYANPLSYTHHLIAGGEEVRHLVIDGYVNPYAFIECEGLESLTINEGVTDIGTAAFSYCTGIKQLNLPASMKEIPMQLFYGCTGLKSLTIPEGVESLGSSAFSSCTGLTGVSLPTTLTTIGSSAFNGCTGLIDLVIPDAVTKIGSSAFSGCSALESISMPDGLISLGGSAFSSCSALTSITIPDGVEVLNASTFEKCGHLNNVVLGRGLKRIGEKAFGSCQVIATIKSRALTPPELASTECFYRNIYKKATLYVPYEALADYKAANLWPWFTTMIGIDVDHERGDVNGDGEITIADINAVIDAILNSNNRSYRYDVNYDGEVNIADINAVIDLIVSE